MAIAISAAEGSIGAARAAGEDAARHTALGRGKPGGLPKNDARERLSGEAPDREDGVDA
ncbi:MAG: hypothetical protein PHV57_06265 [Methanomicrobiaceae archaeon]|nr:hypothetical protein [Methanomicrobiaceae archaeon]